MERPEARKIMPCYRIEWSPESCPPANYLRTVQKEERFAKQTRKKNCVCFFSISIHGIKCPPKTSIFCNSDTHKHTHRVGEGGRERARKGGREKGREGAAYK